MVIDEALLLILRFFNVDRVYIGIFQEDKSTVDFTHEVTRDGIISMREDLLRNQSEEEIPWGVELYDEFGNLLDLNQADMDIFGTTKEMAIGVNMFENPNIPETINKKLRNEEDITFALNYNFQTVSESGYYSTNISQKTKHLQVKGVTLKDSQNGIFGYLYIVSDDTENYLKSEQTGYS